MKLRSALLAITVGLGLLSSALPASAGGKLQYKDPVGDAGVAGAPVPSEDLDITAVNIETVGDLIVWTADIKKVGAGAPQGATGMQYVFSFNYEDTAFTATIIDDQFYGKRTELRGGPNAQTSTLSCPKCLGVVDRKASKAILKTPIASLSGGMRQVDRKYPELKKGGQLDNVSLRSNRMWGVYNDGVGGTYFRQPADDAPAPDEGIYTV